MRLELHARLQPDRFAVGHDRLARQVDRDAINGFARASLAREIGECGELLRKLSGTYRRTRDAGYHPGMMPELLIRKGLIAEKHALAWPHEPDGAARAE